MTLRLFIDASINLKSNNKINDALERTYELYEFCYAQAKKQKKDILIEVGTRNKQEQQILLKK